MSARVSRRRRPAELALVALGLSLLAVLVGGGSARGAVPLGTATSFAVLANTTITNTGATTINGDVGLYPGTSVTGFGTVTRSGALHVGNAVAQQALIDAGSAYGDLQSRTPCQDLTGQVLGQDVGTAADPLLPGVYCFASSAQLTGDLYLSGGGEYVFRIGSTLTTASGSRVILQSGAEACNVYWAVGSSATLGTNSQIAGTIIANVSITANTGAVVDGRLFALTGAVTLDANTIGGMNCPPASTTTTAPAATTTSTVPTTTTTTAVPGTTTTAVPATTTSTAAPATTTTTAVPGTTTSTTTPATTTTTQAPGATTTTQAPGATTTTQAPGATTTTTLPPGVSSTTQAPATTTTTTTLAVGTTTTTPASGTTTSTVGTGTTTTTATDQTAQGLTTTVGPGATTASTGVSLVPAEAGLRVPLARTGQGLSGPLSLAVGSIFLGALLLLAPRPERAVAATQRGFFGPPRRSRAAGINAPTAVEVDRRGARLAPGAARPVPGTTRPHQPVGARETCGPEPGDLLDALERQLHEADARLKAVYGRDWISGAPDSAN
ncbi:MAG TPA: ice-binding family protein [Acidimicrobiales bacterium]|nr:ice-binding family protein [Acidimicrobiales bacterium]